jgi:hypothetical protein
MIETKGKVHKDYKKSQIIESEFKKALEKKNYVLLKSTQDQDRFEGWDFFVMSSPNNHLIAEFIDVKGVKGYNSYNWVELMAYNSYGKRKLGWLLRGKATYMAFKLYDEFFLVNKKKLKEFVINKLPKIKVIFDNCNTEEELFNSIINDWNSLDIETNSIDSEYYKLYTRDGYDHPPDLICKIKIDDIIRLTEFRVKV